MSGLDTQQAMGLAMRRHQAGQVAEAARIYRKVLAQEPQNAEALRLLGVAARQQGQLDEALRLIQQCIAIDPAKAEAHFNLGDVLRSQGKLAEAAKAYAKAIELNPDLAASHLHLGQVLHEQRKHEQAERVFRRAIELQPDRPEAHNLLGNVLWDQAKLDEAIAAFAQADALRPGYPIANWSMGKILLLQGENELALERFRRVAQLNPTNAKAHGALGETLAQLGRYEEAAAAFREALRLKPDSPAWRFKLAAVSGEGGMAAAPASYICSLFDGYVQTFDQRQLEQLDYRVPKLLSKAVAAATQNRDMDVLDLGCGMGLCGRQFRLMAWRLVGVDLAPAMIKAAADGCIYDELITGDIVWAMRQRPGNYDLIVAGDVLIYLGDLSDVFSAVAGSLAPGGLFVFSIEHHDGTGYFLHPQERFAHSISYIRELAARSGLYEISASKVVLRKEAQGEVPGWIVVLSRGGAPTAAGKKTP
ncbi:MAG: tetratricopeptide repeat protein [Tepidisphaeraceae bacterium]|jgi:predicted TPR repeat methyltransferase